jgi:hypothetical protein
MERSMNRCPFLFFALLVIAAGTASAQEPVDITKLFKGSSESKSLTNADIVAGLKEALQVGTTDTVGLTGKVDGYFSNAAIKILLPSQFQTIEQGLRMIGQGQKVDELILAMNRAAEKAAPAAKDIFFSAIQDMTFENARKILSGGDTAATDYFREKTSAELTKAFRPVVDESMREVGVVQQYKQLQSAYQGLPLASALPSFDIESYVVQKALDGLFLVLAEQEKKIRTDPAAQVTSLLKKVFGR